MATSPLWNKSNQMAPSSSSESNIKGLGVVSYRTFDAETAKQFHLCHWTLMMVLIILIFSIINLDTFKINTKCYN